MSDCPIRAEDIIVPVYRELARQEDDAWRGIPLKAAELCLAADPEGKHSKAVNLFIAGELSERELRDNHHKALAAIQMFFSDAEDVLEENPELRGIRKQWKELVTLIWRAFSPELPMPDGIEDFADLDEALRDWAASAIDVDDATLELLTGDAESCVAFTTWIRGAFSRQGAKILAALWGKDAATCEQLGIPRVGTLETIPEESRMLPNHEESDAARVVKSYLNSVARPALQILQAMTPLADATDSEACMEQSEKTTTGEYAGPGEQALNRAKRRIKWLAEAMLLVKDHPEKSNRQIAALVGVDPSTLSRSEEYKCAAAMARENQNIRKGYITRDENDLNDVEAYDE